MHPLVARLHPALRTAVVAWLTSRVIIWSAAPSKTLVVADGSPLSGLTAAALDAISATPGPWSQLTMAAPWIVLEVVLLVAGIAVYRFARSTDLPQLAERACWLWFFNPVLAISAGHWGAQMAMATGALAVAGVVTYRPRRAALAAVIAVGCRLEFILLWPAIAWAGWKSHGSDDEPRAALILSLLAIPFSFVAWIAASWHLAGAANTSLRAASGQALWRDAQTLAPASVSEFLVLLGLATALILALRYVRRFPLWYTLCALPALLWPFVQVPSYLAALSLAWSLPTFVHFAVATDDRAIERPLLAALIIAFLLALTGV